MLPRCMSDRPNSLSSRAYHWSVKNLSKPATPSSQIGRTMFVTIIDLAQRDKENENTCYRGSHSRYPLSNLKTYVGSGSRPGEHSKWRRSRYGLDLLHA